MTRIDISAQTLRAHALYVKRWKDERMTDQKRGERELMKRVVHAMIENGQVVRMPFTRVNQGDIKAPSPSESARRDENRRLRDAVVEAAKGWATTRMYNKILVNKVRAAEEALITSVDALLAFETEQDAQS